LQRRWVGLQRDVGFELQRHLGFELQRRVFVAPRVSEGTTELSQREAGSLMDLLLFVSSRI
jgi:hypothetical protein